MKIVHIVKNIIGRIRGAMPSALPQGMTEFDNWIKSFIEVYQPKMNDRSVRFAIATLMMRLNPTEAYKSKRYFALCLHKGAAAEVSNHVMYLIKEEQKALEQAEKDAAAKAQLEATENQEAPNVTQVSN